MAVYGGLRHPPDLRGVVPDVAPELRGQWRIACRHAVVRCALEDGQVRGGFGDDRRGLDAGGAGADQSDALAAEIDAFMWPLPGVIPPPGERIEPGDVRDIGRRQATHGSDQERRRQDFARFGIHAPDIRRLIVMRGSHAGVEADVALQVETVGDMIEITQDLRRSGITLRPFPFPHQLIGERVTVGMAFRIAACPGIAVPVPGAADPCACLQQPDRKTKPIAQAEQLIKARKPRADDQRVEGAPVAGIAFRRLLDVDRHCNPESEFITVPSLNALSRKSR